MELVVVIILLGILAATALPRFVDIDSEARIAALRGVQGALHTSANLAHASWRLSNSPGYERNFDIGSGVVTTIWGGFPHVSHDTNAEPDIENIITLSDNIVVTRVSPFNTATFTIRDTADVSGCYVEYTEAVYNRTTDVLTQPYSVGAEYDSC